MVKEQEAQGKANNKPTEALKTRSDGSNISEDNGTARPVQSDSAPNKPDKGNVSQARQKYGKVHTRHINQLFIRGENVILVNPQPL